MPAAYLILAATAGLIVVALAGLLLWPLLHRQPRHRDPLDRHAVRREGYQPQHDGGDPAHRGRHAGRPAPGPVVLRADADGELTLAHADLAEPQTGDGPTAEIRRDLIGASA